MHANDNLFLYASEKTKGLYCYSPQSGGQGLPGRLSPWQAIGVLRADQPPPHGLSRPDIESGVRLKGYQMWRRKPKTSPAGGGHVPP
jgi:hypothetical protein